MLRILVVGGGVGGLAVALALRKAGAEATVYESHPDSGQDIGAFLTLAGNGMFALAQVDADQVVDEAGFALGTMRVVGDDGAEMATVPLNRYRCLRRSELCAVLRAEVLRRGIAVRHGKRLVSVSEGPDEVVAHFADGDTATGHLLIGADGLNSTVRSLIDPATPRYAGQRVFYGYTTEAASYGEPGRIDMIRGSGAAFGHARSPGGETYWFARVLGDELPAAEIAATAPARWRATLVPLLRRDATPAADIVAATDRLMVTNACDLPKVERWRTARTLLIGDAAHAASPATGQGASMAIEDAVVLAKALRDSPSVGAALETYEVLRRARVELNVANSARLTAGRSPDRGPRRPDGPPPGVPDEELAHRLDWATATTP